MKQIDHLWELMCSLHDKGFIKDYGVQATSGRSKRFTLEVDGSYIGKDLTFKEAKAVLEAIKSLFVIQAYNREVKSND